MSVRLNYEDDGLIVFYVSGLLSKAEFDAVLTEAETYIQQGNAKLLAIVAADFTGWGNDGDWSDLSYQEENDPYIKKMAIVCAPEWKELSAMFTMKGFRKFPIEHFTPEKEDFARIWLMAD